MHKIKVFRAASLPRLEQEVNDFLTEISEHEIKDIKHASAYNDNSVILTVMVIYIEN